jgi:aspartate aminotransferase-like enzyme
MISFAPGPVQMPSFVYDAMGRAMPHHRSEEFTQSFVRLEERLRDFFSTKQPVICLNGSGTAAMEAGAQNLIRINESVLVVSNGAYGDLWVSILERMGAKVDVLSYEPGQSANLEDVETKLRSSGTCQAVFMQACETSTGILNDVQGIAEVVRRFGELLLIVDASSAVGAIKIEMDNWGIDVMLTSSQKVLMSPPGASFLALSKRAEVKCRADRFTYFDLIAERDYFIANGTSRFTASVMSLLGVASVLEKWSNKPELLKHYRRRMIQLSELHYEIGAFLDMKVFADTPSPTVSVLKLPGFIDGAGLRRLLFERQIFLMGGFGQHRDAIIRIGNMGAIRNSDVLALWSAIFEAYEFQKQVVPHQANKRLQECVIKLGSDLW